jgi:hypothetical protein
LATHGAGRWPTVLGLLGIALLFVALSPYLLSAYHLEAGGRALDQATRSGSTPDQEAITNAKTHLIAALHWQDDNAHAYRLLSRVDLLQGVPQQAAQAQSRYTALEPGNPQGWGELAQIYETMKLDSQALAAWRKGGFTAQDFIMTGESARKANRYKEAQHWYEWAGRLEGEVWDVFPQPYDAQSLIVLENFVTLTSWHLWVDNADGLFEVNNGILEMSYRNTREHRDAFAVASYPRVPCSDSSELLLRLKGDPGTVLTIEVVTDNQLTRLLNYEPVPQDWEVWSLEVSGSILDTIVIGIGESQPEQIPDEYRLVIDWIALR